MAIVYRGMGGSVRIGIPNPSAPSSGLSQVIIMALIDPTREMDPSFKIKEIMDFTIITTFLPTQQKFQWEENHTKKNNFTTFTFSEQRP